MRELKFRAWSNEHNRYCDLVTLIENGRWIGWIKGNGVYLTTIDVTLEQYTGLKDKNGETIYEGDILDDGEGHIGKVLYNERIASFAYEWGNCGSTFMGLYTSDMKVIGNVHENPELLEEKE